MLKRIIEFIALFTGVPTRRAFCMLCAMIFFFQCQKAIAPKDIRKIEFDYSQIDAAGLRRGVVAVDYEFCIPASESALEEIRRIEPEVNLLPKSKGRVGCREDQWLCIVNTRDPAWKRKLYAIAALGYVERIAEVFYE